MRSRLQIAVVLVVACLGLEACGSSSSNSPSHTKDQACTLIGCFSGTTVSVDTATVGNSLPNARMVTVCLATKCRSTPARKKTLLVRDHALNDGTQPVQVVVRGRGGRVLIRTRKAIPLRKLRPNGPNCPPTCWYRALRLDAGAKHLAVAGA
jgi:hypothetical protein